MRFLPGGISAVEDTQLPPTPPEKHDDLVSGSLETLIW